MNRKGCLFLLVLTATLISIPIKTVDEVLRQSWLPIQNQVKDTVVQVFSHIIAIDLLVPFKTPNEYSARGTAFFISGDGYLVTNAHVVEQATAYIQIPSLGKRLFKVTIISIAPERDIALLKLENDDLAFIKKALGAIPYLQLGDSDSVHRSDEVLALGYPLGQESLKSTTGVVSGWEQHFIQTSAPINPGNSGGPLLNMQGEVVGINSSGITEAQNVGYAIPINDLKLILPNLYNTPILKKPFLGILSINATDSMTDYLGNPQPGGCYVVEVIKDSPLYKAGVQSGDMIYQINGQAIDIYGEMNVAWSEDKVSLIDYVGRLVLGQDVHMVIYRHGERKEVTVNFERSDDLPVRHIYPGYEDIDYQVFGGMIVMQLTMNHIKLLGDQAPWLKIYYDLKKQTEPVLVITHIFSNSALHVSRTITAGVTLNAVNDIPVRTVDDFRNALKKSVETGFLTLNAVDTITKSSDNILVVLPFEQLLEEELALLKIYHYPLSDTTQDLFKLAGQADELRELASDLRF